MKNRRRFGVFRILIALSALLSVFPAAGVADGAYRNAVKSYWKETMKEEGLNPTFFASSFHAPRTVLSKNGSKVDYFASGLDLFPATCVEVIRAAIRLPTQNLDKKRSAGLALQLASVPETEIEKITLDVLASDAVKWEIDVSDAEMQFIPIRDARKCLKYRSKEILQKEYIENLVGGEELCVITKAVLVHSGSIRVASSAGLNVSLDAGLTAALSKVGFKISADKSSAEFTNFKDMYSAVGCRPLTAAGLKDSGANAVPTEWVELDLPPELPADVMNLK